jgi:hypothetical protein
MHFLYVNCRKIPKHFFLFLQEMSPNVLPRGTKFEPIEAVALSQSLTLQYLCSICLCAGVPVLYFSPCRSTLLCLLMCRSACALYLCAGVPVLYLPLCRSTWALYTSVQEYLGSIYLCAGVPVLYIPLCRSTCALYTSVQGYLCSIYLCAGVPGLYIPLCRSTCALYTSVQEYLGSIYLCAGVPGLYIPLCRSTWAIYTSVQEYLWTLERNLDVDTQFKALGRQMESFRNIYHTHGCNEGTYSLHMLKGRTICNISNSNYHPSWFLSG